MLILYILVASVSLQLAFVYFLFMRTPLTDAVELGALVVNFNCYTFLIYGVPFHETLITLHIDIILLIHSLGSVILIVI